MKGKIKRELVEWIVLLSIVGIVYFGGWHTEVVGRIQQVVLSTGVLSPNYLDSEKEADYQFLLEDIEGNQVSFNEFENKVTFINFWATWCPPCIAEMPDIHSLYQKRKDEVAFVMISLDKDRQKARDYIAQKEYDFPVFFLKSSLPSTYNTQAIPTTYVLDKNGKIQVENSGMAKYNTEKFNQMLTSLLEAKSP